MSERLRPAPGKFQGRYLLAKQSIVELSWNWNVTVAKHDGVKAGDPASWSWVWT